VEDSRQAVYASKEVYTDERIWFPFLIQHGYGPKKKTLPQIVAEHCTNVEPPQMRKIFPKKGGVIVYRPEERWIRRMEEIQQMAIDSHHMKVFETILNKADTDGQTALVAASKNSCPKIVSYLLKRGIDYNQEDDLGATPLYHAYKSKLGQKGWSSLLGESKFKAVYKSPRPVIEPMQYYHVQQLIEPMQYYHVQQLIQQVHQPNYMDILNFDFEPEAQPVPEPPKKKMKRSEYKKQFGRR
jgi:hypothetical protein